ncbi:MAG: SET domain-containing protein [Planctomycetes bacterium]|nr:SET domain-containing protein [Planctomycetota bacterium]
MSEPTAISSDRPLTVVECGGQRTAVATRDFAPGETILRLTGVFVSRPTRYSVQVSEVGHIEPPDLPPGHPDHATYAWRFLNHSCEPNATFRGETLVAIAPIEKGEEVRFHYAATEYDVAAPFDCRCGSARCIGRVRGYRHLSASERQRIARFAQEHVLDAALRDEREAAR